MAPGRETRARSGEKERLENHPKYLSASSAIHKSVTTEDALQTDNDNSTLPTVVRKVDDWTRSDFLMAPLPKPRRDFLCKRLNARAPQKGGPSFGPPFKG